MDTIKSLIATFLFLSLLAGCASGSKSAPSGVAPELKVTSSPGRLKAKLLLKNTSAHDLVVKELDPKNFKVETADNKAMPLKAGNLKATEPVTIKPGETAELTFNLQDNYPFWDRLTKYRIWYEGSGLKTNVVQVWY